MDNRPLRGYSPAMLRRLFQGRSKTAAQVAPRRALAPPQQRIHAIGDIHGRLDLLTVLHDDILADRKARPHDGKDVIVYLGDYVDRGPYSREVIDYLLGDPLPGFTAVHLMGNHDEAMLQFLDDASIGPTWASFGGESTLLSYGVRTTPGLIGMRRYEGMRQQLVEKMPQSHAAFLRGLQLSYQAGDYLFAHAGVRPGVPLDQQDPDDLMWIRETFLSSSVDHGKIVVHGHTPTDEPQVRVNRIGIDTGAFASGILTCLVLEGGERRFLSTGTNDWSGLLAAQ
jgi:serine/threonine protein phosphatase 1